MKTLKTKFFAFAFLALGFSALTTSCGKEKTSEDICKVGENPADATIEGFYSGTHSLNIPASVLKGLSDALPVDPETGEKPDLTKGFADTLEVRVVDDVVKVTSSLLDITVDGRLTGKHSVKIDRTEYESLSLGTAVTAEGASLATSKDVKFNLRSSECPTTVELRLTSKKIASFQIPLDITTKGDFVKFAN